MGTEPGVPLAFQQVPYREPEPPAIASSVERCDMPDSVLDGRLGEICQRRLNHFPLAYSWGALLTTAGAMMSRTNSPIRPNLYWCAVGPVGSGKSQSTETVFHALGLGSPVLMKAKFGSAEGLVEKLKDIEADGVRLIYPDELGHLLSKAAIDRSSFAYILNTAFYDDYQTGGSKGKPFDIDCRLSLAGGVVEELFGDLFGNATTGGLYDRFLFGLCPAPYTFLWRPLEGQAERLHLFRADVEAEVWDARDQWVKDGIAPRVAEHALRAAYIAACADARPKLRASELGPAFALAQYQMRVRLLLAPNPGENPDARCAIAIRNWLKSRAADGKWIRRRDLDRGIHSDRLGPGVFNRCILNLAFNHEIELATDGKTLRLCE